MSSLVDNVRRWGPARAFHMALMSRIENYLKLYVLMINTRRLNPRQPEPMLPAGDQVSVLSPGEMRTFLPDPELDLDEDFLTAAAERGDMCVAYIENMQLVAYVWLGLSTAPITPGLSLNVGETICYSYKAYTLPSHRGRRLQQLMLPENDRWLVRHGYLYNVDYIKSHNYPSITADRRYGNTTVGYVVYKLGNRRIFTWCSAGARRHGVSLVTST